MQTTTTYIGERNSMPETRCTVCGEVLRNQDQFRKEQCLTCGNSRFYLLDLRVPFDN